MGELLNDIYTENDVKESIDSGNIYIEPNIKGTLETINDYEFVSNTLSLYNITQGTLSCNIKLELTDTESYISFKDGSYIRAKCMPTWTLLQLNVLRFEWYFGLMDEETQTVTEYYMGGVTGIPTQKEIWRKSYDPIQGEVWLAGDPIDYQPGDLFHFALSWADPFEFDPHLRYIFIPYLVGGEYSALNWYNSLNPNILGSGLQYSIPVTDGAGQIFAAYLCGYSTEGTKYPGEDSEAGGGNGTYYNVNDDIDFTPIPNIQAIDFGFNSIYNPTEADMRALSDWLWSGDYTDSVKLNQISPMENILNIAIVALPESLIKKRLSTIKIAGIRSNIQSRKVIKQYVELNCGTLAVSEYWGGYLDYNANFSIWLPYIGFRSLRPDDLLRGDLTVRYVIDLLTGAAVCEIRSILPDPQIKNRYVKHILYSYNCNVFYNLAISCSNYMNMYNQQFNATVSGISNFVNSAAQIGGSLATGNVLGAVNGAINLVGGGSKAKQDYDSAKPEFGRGGNSGGNSGFFSYKKPYLVRSQPKEQSPKNYKKLQGVPAEIYAKLSKLSGYTEVDKVIVDTLVHCTAEEKTSILAMLSSGVYL